MRKPQILVYMHHIMKLFLTPCTMRQAEFPPCFFVPSIGVHLSTGKDLSKDRTGSEMKADRLAELQL